MFPRSIVFATFDESGLGGGGGVDGADGEAGGFLDEFVVFVVGADETEAGSDGRVADIVEDEDAVDVEEKVREEEVEEGIVEGMESVDEDEIKAGSVGVGDGLFEEFGEGAVGCFFDNGTEKGRKAAAVDEFKTDVAVLGALIWIDC